MISSYKIFVIKGETRWSKPIKFLSGSKYSHIGLTIPNDRKFDIDIGKHAEKSIFNYNINDYELYEIVGLTEEQKLSIDKAIEQHLDVEYSNFENIRFLLYKWLKIETKDDKLRMNCIELVLDIIESATGIVLTSEKYPIFEDVISSPYVQRIL